MRALTCALLLCASLPLQADALLDARLDALATELDPRAAAALVLIDGTERRVLAARSYVRSSTSLAQRWSWDSAQTAAFLQSPGRIELDAAIAQVICRFQRSHPEHTLFVNPEFRTLERQVERWNTNVSVAQAAADLAAKLRLASTGMPPETTEEGRRQFRQLLADTRPSPTPALAAPGLSRHGQMGAIDFQVMKGDQLVAGTEADSAQEQWDEAGWTSRLRGAVEAADAGFTGPLKEPYEPWHYEFAPNQSGPASGTGCYPE
jgi:hypothetical protein